MLQDRNALKGIIQLLSSNNGDIMVLFWLNWLLSDRESRESERPSYVDAVTKRNTESTTPSRLFEYMLAGAYSDVKVGKKPGKEYGIEHYKTALATDRKAWDDKVKSFREARMQKALASRKDKKPIDGTLKVSDSEHRLCYA